MAYEVRMTFEPKPDLPIAEVIRDFVVKLCTNDTTTVVCMGDYLFFILKDITPGEWDKAQKQAQEIQSLDTERAMEIIKEWGTTFPFIQIDTNKCTVSVMYHRTVVLDLQYPQFFNHLEMVLDHVLKNSDLSQFSLPSEIASLSDRD